MGRGLSPQQSEILAFLSDKPEGHRLYISKWDFGDDSEFTMKQRRQHNVAAASQSRTLHRLEKRGLVEKFLAGSKPKDARASLQPLHFLSGNALIEYALQHPELFAPRLSRHTKPQWRWRLTPKARSAAGQT
jgi:hypothetical protein